MTVSSETQVLSLLEAGKRVRDICDLTTWPRRNVTRLAARAGFLIDVVADVPYRPPEAQPDPIDVDAGPEPTPSPAPPLTQMRSSPVPTVGESLLARGEASTNQRIRAAAARARAALDHLGDVLKADDARRAERARKERERRMERDRRDRVRAAAADDVRRAEEQLAAAKAKLRATRNTTPNSATGPARTRAQKIREYARANGIPCKADGKLPKAAVDAYEAAHPEQVAS